MKCKSQIKFSENSVPARMALFKTEYEYSKWKDSELSK